MAANFKGKPFFAAVAQGRDPMPAVLYSAISGTVQGAIIGLIYMFIFAIFGAALMAAMGAGAVPLDIAGAGAGMAIAMFVTYTISGAMSGFIYPWIMGGLHHLVLMMVGGIGPGRDYSHTVRAHAYAQASLVFWYLTIIGAPVALVFMIINHINAYDEMHRCGAGKALLAVFAPVLVCCCCYLMLLMMGGAMSGFSTR